MPRTDVAESPLLDSILAYEVGELSLGKTVTLFAELVKTGQAWQLQGSYGRTARQFIDLGYISDRGEVLIVAD